MVYRIATERDYLRAELFNRETAEEAREFFDAVADSATRHHRSRILISVHSSNPMFTVERSGFLTRFTNVGVDPSHKIALIADDRSLITRMSIWCCWANCTESTRATFATSARHWNGSGARNETRNSLSAWPTS